jgi:putative flippase GtrA
VTAEESGRPGLLRRLLGHSAVKYLLTGGAAFLLDLGLLALFKQVFDWPTGVAAGTAFLLSFAFTYTAQRYFTFGSSAPHGSALVKYTLLVGFNTLATAGIVALIDQVGAGWLIGKIIATTVTTVWNYFAYRYWVFADQNHNER